MRLLLRTPNWLGDIVMAVPAMKSLRVASFDAQIDVLAPPWAADLFGASRLFDGFIPFDAVGVSSAVSLARGLRNRRYDLGILLTNSFSSAFSMRLTGARRRLGYPTDGRAFLLTDRVALPDPSVKRHQVFYYLDLARAAEKVLDIELPEGPAPDTSIDLPQACVSDADKFLSNLGVGPGRPVIALGIGSANSDAKRWPPDRYAALNDRLQDELGAVVVLIGSGSDHEAAARVSEFARREPLDLTGQTDIARAAGILKLSNVVVSNDMGLAHLSAAVGTPTFVIFGPTDADATRPFSPMASVISASVECSPCMLRQCPIDHRCMTRVSADQVFEEASRALAAA